MMRTLAVLVTLAGVTACNLAPTAPATPGPSYLTITPERPTIGSTFALELKSIPRVREVPDGTYTVSFQEIEVQEFNLWNLFSPPPTRNKRGAPAEPVLAGTFEVKDGIGTIQLTLTATLKNEWGEAFNAVPGKPVGLMVRGQEMGGTYGFHVGV